MRTANSALLMKGLWSFFHSPSTPWVTLLRAKHYKLRPPMLSHKAPAGCAPIWKDMLKLAAPFNTSISFTLGNGSSLSFWSARWFEDSTLMNQFLNLYAASTTKKASVATWIRRFAPSLYAAFTLPPTRAEHEELLRLAPLTNSWRTSNHPDIIRWRWSTSGTFSSRNAYAFLADSGVNDGKINFVWASKVPLRVKLFLWLAAKNRILTADTLAKKGWIGPSICVFCFGNVETLQHLLHDCHFTTALWTRLLQRLCMGSRQLQALSGDLATRWRILRASLLGSSRAFFDQCFAAACWEIWKERNARLFNNHHSTSVDLEDRVFDTANFWASTLGG